MAVLNRATATNSYILANQLDFAPSQSVTITVTNASVVLQFATAPPGQEYSRAGAYPYDGVDRECVPGVYGWSASDFQGNMPCGVKFKSVVDVATLTLAPVVTITA